MIAMVAVVMMGHASAAGPTFVSAEFTTDTNMDVVFATAEVDTANHTQFTSSNFTVTGATVDGPDATIVHVTISGLSSADQTDGLAADATGLQLGVGAVTNATNDSIAYVNQSVAGDTTPPTMSSAARVDNTHITVTMSESVTNLTTSSDGGFIVAKNGDPETTYAVSDIAAGSSANLVVLTVADISGSIATGVKVTYNASVDNGTINDTAGNALATDTTGVIVAAWQTSSGGSGGDGTYPPGWHETPTATVTATKAPTPSATATATDAPPGDKVTPAPTKKPEAAKTTTPAAEGTTAETPKSTPGFTAVFVIAGMLAVAYAMMRRRE